MALLIMISLRCIRRHIQHIPRTIDLFIIVSTQLSFSHNYLVMFPLQDERNKVIIRTKDNGIKPQFHFWSQRKLRYSYTVREKKTNTSTCQRQRWRRNIERCMTLPQVGSDVPFKQQGGHLVHRYTKANYIKPFHLVPCQFYKQMVQQAHTPR